MRVYNIYTKNMKIKETKPNIGKRILAGLIDYFIIYSFFFYYIFTFGEPNGEGEYHISGLPGLIPIIFWGIITIGIEQWFGATIGNMLVKLKPKSIYNTSEFSTLNEVNKITVIQSFKRHLLDPIDIFFFGLVGIILIKNTEKNQRLGDIWANTIVINKI